MSWPLATGVSPQGSIAVGVLRTGTASYFKWGTDEVLTVVNGVTVSGFIVIERLRQHRKKTNKEYMNGSGVQTGRVQLFHGVIWEATIRDDARLTGIPNEGTYGTLVDLAGHISTPALTYTAYLLDSDYEAEPGEPGKRSMLFERIKLIEG